MNQLPYNHIKLISFLILGAIALVGFTFANAPTVKEAKSASSLSKYKEKKYKKDASRLALRLLNVEGNYKSVRPNLPEDLVQSIYNALVAIHTSKSVYAEAVTSAHKLHTFPSPNVDRFFVIYRRDAAWAMPLRLGGNETTNEQINSLCKEFGLVIESNVEWDEEHNSFYIRAKNALNIAPIADLFLNIQGIEKVDLLEPSGDGNDIVINQLADGWQLSYLVKFDSCITGCKKKHSWEFKVNTDGEVAFLGETGDELPAWMLQN